MSDDQVLAGRLPPTNAVGLPVPATTHVVGWTSLLAVFLYSSCGQHAITLQYRDVEDDTFSRAELRTIQAIADDTTHEVRRLLPALPAALALEVFPADDVSEELGYKGSAHDRVVYWGVDPHHGEGLVAMAEDHLRAFLVSSLFRVVRNQVTDPWDEFTQYRRPRTMQGRVSAKRACRAAPRRTDGAVSLQPDLSRLVGPSTRPGHRAASTVRSASSPDAAR